MSEHFDSPFQTNGTSVKRLPHVRDQLCSHKVELTNENWTSPLSLHNASITTQTNPKLLRIALRCTYKCIYYCFNQLAMCTGEFDVELKLLCRFWFSNHKFRCGRSNLNPLLVYVCQNLHYYDLKPIDHLLCVFRHYGTSIFSYQFEWEMECILQNERYLPLYLREPDSFATSLISLLFKSSCRHTMSGMERWLPTKVAWKWQTLWIQTVPGWVALELLWRI